jgi:hypothetical protein
VTYAIVVLVINVNENFHFGQVYIGNVLQVCFCGWSE